MSKSAVKWVSNGNVATIVAPTNNLTLLNVRKFKDGKYDATKGGTQILGRFILSHPVFKIECRVLNSGNGEYIRYAQRSFLKDRTKGVVQSNLVRQNVVIFNEGVLSAVLKVYKGLLPNKDWRGKSTVIDYKAVEGKNENLGIFSAQHYSNDTLTDNQIEAGFLGNVIITTDVATLKGITGYHRGDMVDYVVPTSIEKNIQYATTVAENAGIMAGVSEGKINNYEDVFELSDNAIIFLNSYFETAEVAIPEAVDAEVLEDSDDEDEAIVM
jgi:hypothetical protein